MVRNPQNKISAQVVLAPASGAAIDPNVAITSHNIEQYLPSSDAASTVRESFSRAGFEVGPLVGNSFSITAPVKTFEEFFKTKLREDAKGGLKARSGKNVYAQELPLSALPDAWKKPVTAVTFTPPPAFGPTGY
jgi:hypothetical protein